MGRGWTRTSPSDNSDNEDEDEDDDEDDDDDGSNQDTAQHNEVTWVGLAGEDDAGGGWGAAGQGRRDDAGCEARGAVGRRAPGTLPQSVNFQT